MIHQWVMGLSISSRWLRLHNDLGRRAVFRGQGFHIHGGSPICGWLMENPLKNILWFRGYPEILGNLCWSRVDSEAEKEAGYGDLGPKNILERIICTVTCSLRMQRAAQRSCKPAEFNMEPRSGYLGVVGVSCSRPPKIGFIMFIGFTLNSGTALRRS